MSETRGEPDSAPAHDAQASGPVRYPQNHVVGVVDTPEALREAVERLTGGGFLDSEIEILWGRAAAARLDASTGRTGLAHLAIRVAERLGVRNDEMKLKDHYEQALRDGKMTVAIWAPTEERKKRAAEILREAGGHSVNFLGRFTIEGLVPHDQP